MRVQKADIAVMRQRPEANLTLTTRGGVNRSSFAPGFPATTPAKSQSVSLIPRVSRLRFALWSLRSTFGDERKTTALTLMRPTREAW
jgi:hypothetical protein